MSEIFQQMDLSDLINVLWTFGKQKPLILLVGIFIAFALLLGAWILGFKKEVAAITLSFLESAEDVFGDKEGIKKKEYVLEKLRGRIKVPKWLLWLIKQKSIEEYLSNLLEKQLNKFKKKLEYIAYESDSRGRNPGIIKNEKLRAVENIKNDLVESGVNSTQSIFELLEKHKN